MFEYAYDLAGGGPAINAVELPIVSTTAILKGALVAFTPGVGVVAATGSDLDDPVIGVAAEDHDGATDDGRQKGTKIRVHVSPTAVFALTPKANITATGGSTTTFAATSVLPATDDYFTGGAIKITACAADPTLVGRVVRVSGYVGVTKVFTLAETLPATLAAGDTAVIMPGPLAITAFQWDLTTGNRDIDFTSSGGETLQIVNSDPERFKLYVKLRLHQFANHPVAL